MNEFNKKLKSFQKASVQNEPTILDLNNTSDRKTISDLIKKKKVQHVIDDFEEQLRELFAVNHPTIVYTPGFNDHFKIYLAKLAKQKPLENHGRWVFYDWSCTLVHVLIEKDFQKVRTARNRYLITPEDQEKFYNSVVGIGGLSVGNSVALTIVLQGGAKYIKLADFDLLALSNLNRIRAGVQTLGLNKAVLTARQIYEINPYARVILFPTGLTPENIDAFFIGTPKLDVVIDELDNIAIKFLIREKAKQYKLPVLMGADNGDNAVIDIERYDQKPQPKFFHGRIGKTSFEKLKNLDKFGVGRTITRHIGPENITLPMQYSLTEMGKTIVSWPQLGGAALLNGSAIAYALKRIITGQPLENNRKIVSLDELLDPTYNSNNQRKKRKNASNSFKKAFGL